jgi:hypothetical protein
VGAILKPASHEIIHKYDSEQDAKVAYLSEQAEAIATEFNLTLGNLPIGHLLGAQGAKLLYSHPVQHTWLTGAPIQTSQARSNLLLPPFLGLTLNAKLTVPHGSLAPTNVELHDTIMEKVTANFNRLLTMGSTGQNINHYCKVIPQPKQPGQPHSADTIYTVNLKFRITPDTQGTASSPDRAPHQHPAITAMLEFAISYPSPDSKWQRAIRDTFPLLDISEPSHLRLTTYSQKGVQPLQCHIQATCPHGAVLPADVGDYIVSNVIQSLEEAPNIEGVIYGSQHPLAYALDFRVQQPPKALFPNIITWNPNLRRSLLEGGITIITLQMFDDDPPPIPLAPNPSPC